MEIKKVSSASLENKTHEFLLMGLVVALGFLFIVFEWSTTETKKPVVTNNDDMFVVEDLIPITVQKPLTPPAPAVAAPPKVIAPKIVVSENPVKEVDIVIPDVDDPVVDLIPTPTEEFVDEDIIFVRVEKDPVFPGGPKAMMKFLRDNIKYPAICSEAGIQGRVIVSFVVNKDGSIEQVELLNSVHERLDAEALRVVKLMPAWTPGEMQGHAVRAKFNLPVMFRLAN